MRHYEPSLVEVQRGLGGAMIAGIAIFFLNDFALGLPSGIWLFSDWILRSALIMAFFVPIRVRRPLIPLFTAPEPLSMFCWSVFGVGISGLAFGIARTQLAADGIWTFPDLARMSVVADAIVGMPLVALSEELVFRAAPFLLFRKHWPGWWIIGSSVLFGICHWGHGSVSVVAATVIGIVLALSLQFTRTLYPALFVHFVSNIINFSLPRL